MVERRESGKRLAGLGSLVLAWTFFDGLILGVPILLVTTAIGLPLIVFAIGAVVWAVVNLGVCGWIEREWDAWIVGTRFETKLEKFRTKDRVQRPIEWIAHGSPILFALAAILTSAGETIALHRLIAGRSARRSRFLGACLGPALFWSALFAGFGFVVHQTM